jgi:hypothetical protein
MNTKPEENKKPRTNDENAEAANRGGDLGPTKGAEKQRPRSKDETLDEALEESFPASDPPAQTVPGSHADRK